MWENVKTQLRKLMPVGFDVEKAVRGLESLKKKEGFDKLPPARQKEFIDDYIKGIKLEKQVPGFLKPKSKKPRKILPEPKSMKRWYA